MQRTNIIELKPSKKQEKILKECMLLSSCIYNSANYIVRQQFFNGENIDYFFDLIRKLQNTEDYKMLGRVYSTPRLQIFSEMISSRFKLIKSKKQKNIGLPKYLKNRKTNTTIPSYLVMDNYQFSIGKNKVTIPLSRQMRKKYNIKHFNINYNGALKFKGKQCRSQIHYKNNKFYLYQSVEVEEPKKIQSNVIAGLDLGIKNLVAVYVNNEQEKIIGSKRFFKQWSYITKLISEEQIKLSKINRKASNKLHTLFEIRKKYQQNLFNNIVGKTFRFLKRNNVSKIVIGDVKNIRNNNDVSKLVNQMVHNYWSFDILLKKLKNKAEEYGIEVILTTEEYTSRTCPECDCIDEKNINDRVFCCVKCGYKAHRDVNGARNIMIKGMNDLVNNRSVHGCEIVPLEVL